MTVTRSIQKYLSLVKFAHTVFALPFALLAFFMAASNLQFHIHWWLLIPVLLCMITARNAAMAFNRYADNRFDKLNPRTAIREIPAGIIKPNAALFFALINVVLFVVSTSFINPLCMYLSPVALFIILGYSYTKRFTFMCHFVLGTGLALAPIGAYIAVTGRFAIEPVLLGCVVLCWVSGFDIIYAMQDMRFDIENKLHSIPAVFGNKFALRLSVIMHILAAIFLCVFMYLHPGGFLFYTGVFIFISLLVYQHSIVTINDLSRVNLAFFTTNGMASVIFCALAIADLLV